jgi:hypothetical protein
MPEYLKIRYLTDTIRIVPALQGAIDRYFDEVPNIKDQTYAGLSIKMANFVANRGDSITTSASAGATTATATLQAQLDETRRDNARM